MLSSYFETRHQDLFCPRRAAEEVLYLVLFDRLFTPESPSSIKSLCLFILLLQHLVLGRVFVKVAGPSTALAWALLGKDSRARPRV